MYSHVVAGVDVGTLFRYQALRSNAQLVGVWYCGRCFEASNERDLPLINLQLPEFEDMRAFVVKRELRETLFRLVAAGMPETARVQNYLQHKAGSSPASAGDALRQIRQMQWPRVTCKE